MVAWSSLPVEIRHDIVKEMDFRTRFRFRHVSKTDQQIVDSVPLNLPRIVLKFENDDKAKLEFYLGINRKITVDFEKSRTRVVKVKVSGESIDNPVEKLVKFESSVLLAFTTFKNVANPPKTLFAGFEACSPDQIASPTFFKIYQLIRKTTIRTKIISSNGESMLALLLPFCSDPDLREIQSFNPQHPTPMHMLTWTRNLQITTDFRETFNIVNIYISVDVPTMGECSEWLQHTPGSWEFKKHGFNDHSNNGSYEGDSGYQYTRMSNCGSVTHWTASKVQNENPGVCELRWACPQHADPFEYWYLQHVIKPDAKDLSIPFQIPSAREYREVIYPILNGHDPVLKEIMKVKMQMEECEAGELEEMMNDLRLKEECARLIEEADEILGVSLESEFQKFRAITKELKATDERDSDDSEDEEEAEEKVEEKVLDKEESGDSEDSEDSEGSEDSEAPEANSNSSESNLKIDKFWAILMIFAVLSLIFALFFTFF